MKKLAAVFALTALLAACSEAPPPAVSLNTDTGSKIDIDVRTVSLTDRSGMPSSVYATDNLQPTIAEAIKQWAAGHLQADGRTGDAIIVIKDASIVHQPIPHAGQWFTREQTSKYSAHAEIELQIRGEGGAFAIATAQASRYETLPENPTEAEKHNAYTTLLNGMLQDLSKSLETSMHAHLQHFIVGAPAGM